MRLLPRLDTKRIVEFGLGGYLQSDNGPCRGIQLIEPLGYIDFLCMMKNARLVLTDSGGVQEETTCLGVPCVTLRENTERPVTLELGMNVLAGTSTDGIRAAISEQMNRKPESHVPEMWDGKAAERILATLLRQATSGGGMASKREVLELRPEPVPAA